ncbi:MAG: methyltransferase domain-containing protein [Bacteroidota bacterium]
MKLFKSFKVPVEPSVELRFNEAVLSLHQKLKVLDVEQLNVSAYSKKYFKDYQRKLQYSLEACAFILMHALADAKKQLSEITIVDYGAGTGVLAMLAKEVGFGRVIYNDIYDVSCRDASLIAHAAAAKADDYICGDVSSLCTYFKQGNYTCDTIVSRNVIEHIYDLEAHFKQLSAIPSDKLNLFFATTANINNPLTVWYTQRIQRMLEFKGMANKWGKERDTTKPFLISRQEIILDVMPSIEQAALHQIAKATRGLMKSEIEEATKSYMKNKQINVKPASGCNTCDPYTGNWAEHLLPIETYEQLFKQNGFSFSAVSGFYNTNYAKKWLNLFTPLVNMMIKILGHKGTYLSPFIGLKGVAKKG